MQFLEQKTAAGTEIEPVTNTPSLVERLRERSTSVRRVLRDVGENASDPLLDEAADALDICHRDIAALMASTDSLEADRDRLASEVERLRAALKLIRECVTDLNDGEFAPTTRSEWRILTDALRVALSSGGEAKKTVETASAASAALWELRQLLIDGAGLQDTSREIRLIDVALGMLL